MRAVNTLSANWSYPTAIRFGADRAKELPEACVEIGVKHPLLVTDPGLARLPMVIEAAEGCNQQGLECDIFRNIKANPTAENVRDGVQAYREGQYDGVVAFGGGSALDAGKAIAFMAGQDRHIWAFEDVGDNWRLAKSKSIAPIVALPTTSGTGSEVGRAAVITDSERRAKRVIFHPRMMPSIVIADPVLTIGLPPNLTAATGMDALSHNLEAYYASQYHPMAEGIAVEGTRLVKEWLPGAFRDGRNLEARSHMMVAAMMGATAFQRGLGAMHALAHPLGALYDAHHGLLNAVLMPYVLQANRPAIELGMTRLARYLGLADPSYNAVLGWALSLRADLRIPENLSRIGIDEDHVEEIGRRAVADPSSAGNPVPLDAAGYARILRNAIRGDLG